MQPGGCPTDDQLVSFNLGDLPDDLVDAITEHLESCTRCETRAERLDNQIDPVIATLRKTALGSSSPGGASQGEAGAAEACGEAPRHPRPEGYEVEELLGEGGMGVVYKARHLRLNRVVALKMIAHHSSRVSARFRIEAEAVARLQHPNIVQIFEIGDHEGRPFLALEFVDGGSLEHQLAARPQPPRRAAEMLRTLALAADYAHRRGIVHRDLKPSNILMTHEGVLKIADFGVAKRLEGDDSWSGDGDIMGTPRYMAPEQASGRADRVGPATDVYSLGVLLYEMLTGRAPHQAATSFETLSLVCEQEPVPPRQLQPKLPRDLETIALKCLRKDPAKRYGDAQALVEDLDRFLSGRPILARPAGARERVYKWARRHPTLSCLVAAAVLGVSAIGVVAWHYNATLRWYNAELRVAAHLAEREAEQATAARRLAQKHASAEAEQRRKAEAALYFSRIGLAEGEWRNDNVAGAELLLGQCLPSAGRADDRGWEWRYLERLCHADLLTLAGHGSWVHQVAYSPDGTRLVAAAGLPLQLHTRNHQMNQGTLRVWDVAGANVIAQLNGHAGAVWDVAYSPDGRRIASAGAEGTVCIWDAATFRRSAEWKVPAGEAMSVRFSPDGQHLAIANGRSIVVWDLATDRERPILDRAGGLGPTAFSADGRRLAARDAADTVVVLDVASGRPIRTLKRPRGRVMGVAFSPDGLRLAAAGSDGLVVVWDAATGQVIHELSGHGGESTCVAFSPDGRYLASGGGDQTVRLWDASNGVERVVFRGHTFGVRSVTFSPDGERIASASQDGTVKIWDVTRDPRSLALQSGDGGEWVGSLAFSADAARLALVRHDRGLLLTWDSALGIPASEAPIDVTGRYFCPRGDSAFSADGRTLAAASHEDDRVIKVWDVATGRELRAPLGHNATVTGVAFSPNGKRIASASCDRASGSPSRLTVWDVATGRALGAWFSGHRVAISRLAFSPDGASLASANGDGTIQVWTAATGREVLHLAAHRGKVNGIVFSPDSRRLASVAHVDPTVRVWDVATGRGIFTLRGHNHPLTDVAYSPDGRLLASVGFEGAVKLWDAMTGQDVLTLRGSGPQRPGDHFFNARLAFSRDGSRIASNSWDGRVNIWEAGEITPQSRMTESRLAHGRAFAWHLREADPSSDRREGRAFGDRFHLRYVDDREPLDDLLRVARGHLYIRLGRWEEADADIARVLAAGRPNDVRLWSEHACLRLLAGDREGYRRARDHLVKHHGGTDDPVTAYFLARTCTVSADEIADPDCLVRWARQAQLVTANAARALDVMGAACYRTGRWDEAVGWLTRTSDAWHNWDGRVISHFLLAMTQHRLGHPDEARTWLEPFSLSGKKAAPSLKDVHDLLVYHLLRRQAESLVTEARAEESSPREAPCGGPGTPVIRPATP